MSFAESSPISSSSRLPSCPTATSSMSVAGALDATRRRRCPSAPSSSAHRALGTCAISLSVQRIRLRRVTSPPGTSSTMKRAVTFVRLFVDLIE